MASIPSVSTLTGCHGSSAQPEALFQGAYGEYVHGNLEAAHTRAEQAAKEFSTAGSERALQWALKFRLLDAQVLLTQGRPADAIALLACAGASIPTQSDSAIKWHVLCGLAHSRLDQIEESERELRAAHQLAESTRSSLIAEVLRAEGLAAGHSGHRDEAREKFRSSLAALGEGGDLLVKADDLVDLGNKSLQKERYAEALDWSQRAADLAGSIQARRPLEMALGNAGWAYQNLGDFDRALANFQDAERQAHEIGMTVHRVVWLQNAGLAEYRLGNLDEARKYDEEALRSALTLPAAKEVNQITNIEVNLALLLYEQGQYDAAKRYSDAAVVMARKSKDNTVIAYVQYVQGLIASRLTTDKEAESILMSAWQLAPDPDLRAEIESAIARLYSGRQQTEQAIL